MCGAGGVGTTFHYTAQYLRKNPRGGGWACGSYTGLRRHLCRLCENCGYGWPEACADASGDVACHG
jgi:hypothetical protein